MIEGRAIKITTKPIVSQCGFSGPAGYMETTEYGADAKLSFMPKIKRFSRINEIIIEERTASVVKSEASLYISGMCTFFVKYKEEPDGTSSGE